MQPEKDDTRTPAAPAGSDPAAKPPPGEPEPAPETEQIKDDGEPLGANFA